MGLGGIDFSGAQFGMINTLKTGNNMLDMALCMLIPALFAALFAFYENRLQPWVRELIRKFREGSSGLYSREIVYELMRNSWGSVLTGGDERNNVLQKAITLYLNEHNLSYKTAGCSLMSVKHKRHDYDDSDDEDEDGGSGRGGAGALKKYALTTVAPHGSWVEVSKGVEFQQTSNEDTEGEENSKMSKKRIRFAFQSYEANGEKLINDFIAKAWKYYLAELDKMKDKGRYMYNLISTEVAKTGEGEGGDSSQDAKKFKRYKLSDEKTFESLFFPEKETLLTLLDHFGNKTGKYRIKGFPHKLGLLLHGPPGTGKTSLIKALAHATNRSIVNIPLARIKTNQELTDLMYDLRYNVGEDVPVKLRYKDIIFVMEDIDAASKIVHRRDASRAPAKVEMVQRVERPGGESSTTRLTREESIPAPPPLPTPESEDAEGPVAGPLLPGGEGGTDMLEVFAALASSDDKKTSSSYFSRTDKLDLSGLLNVLDGVVDTPQRILVMTTNHPEKLDPALIRPGRVDKKLFLGYLRGECACSMLQHYFPESTLSSDQKGLISEILQEHDFTPAQVEQLCAEHDSIDDMLKALWRKTQPAEPVRGLSRAASHAMQ